jgi:hypothetical protein
MRVLERIPPLKLLVPVYAVIAAIIYTWSVIQFFWDLSGWLYFSSLKDVFVIFAYLMTVNLIESLLILGLVVILFLLFFRLWGRDQFVVKSALLVVSGLAFLIYRNIQFPTKALYGLSSVQWIFLSVIGVLIMTAPLNKAPAFSSLIESIADRFIILLYIMVPMSVISLAVVIFRNLI